MLVPFPLADPLSLARTLLQSAPSAPRPMTHGRFGGCLMGNSAHFLLWLGDILQTAALSFFE